MDVLFFSVPSVLYFMLIFILMISSARLMMGNLGEENLKLINILLFMNLQAITYVPIHFIPPPPPLSLSLSLSAMNLNRSQTV